MNPNLINLTGVIGANVALTQPWYAGTIGVIVAAILGALLAGGVGIYRDIENDKRKKRDDKIQAHCNLLGCKHAFLQYLHSYFLANVAARSSQPYAKLVAIMHIDFVEVKKILESGKKEDAEKYVNILFSSEYLESIDLKESLRSKERSENLQLQIGDVKERFWKFIGQVKIAFEDNRIKDFIKEIEKAEATLGSFYSDVSKDFKKIEDDINTGIGKIIMDQNDMNRYANDPNKNRDDFFDKMVKTLEGMKDSTALDAKVKIENLESKIDDLLTLTLHVVGNNPNPSLLSKSLTFFGTSEMRVRSPILT
jgi:hypothetical protein